MLCLSVDIQVLREKQMSVSRELEEKQTTCQQLHGSVDELEVQIDTLSEERQRVSCQHLCTHPHAHGHISHRLIAFLVKNIFQTTCWSRDVCIFIYTN